MSDNVVTFIHQSARCCMCSAPATINLRLTAFESGETVVKNFCDTHAPSDPDKPIPSPYLRQLEIALCRIADSYLGDVPAETQFLECVQIARKALGIKT